MRLLLIAYEFPPSPSPQSLRWTYLCRELAARGHEIHVLTVNLGGTTPGLPDLPATIRIHRTFAGPFRGLLALRREQKQKKIDRRRSTGHAPSARQSEQAALRPPRSWKQGISERLQAISAWYWFPDIRGEWKPSTKWALRKLLPALQPDAIISSHEPATTLELGLIAKRAGYPWLADLGDPVLAPYTPSRWTKRSFKLERKVCELADHVVVTNIHAMELLASRHGRDARISVVQQGFDAAAPENRPSEQETASPQLELLYTGSFYSFRKADSLLAALRQNPGVRLSIAAITVPEDILACAKRMPEQIRLLGFLPHKEALARQRQADVLVNIANEDPAQVPGKFYEYLGSGRPILHLGPGASMADSLLVETGRGWQCDNDSDAIAETLRQLRQAKITGTLPSFPTHDESIAAFSWQRLAERIEQHLQTIVK